jgi:hypothetical protein
MSLFKSGAEQPEGGKQPIPAEEDAVLEKVAKKVVSWRMAVPAIMFLESVKPLNYIGAQTMVFFEPIVQTVFNFKDYEIFRQALERRENIENLLQKIEKYDAILYDREKSIKKFLKTKKKNWRWHQKWLGIGRPKTKLPPELSGPLFPDKKEQDKEEKK